MAEEIRIQGAQEAGKTRHPLGILGLMIITLGVYFFVWWYKTQTELATLGRARGTSELGDSPGTSLAAMVPGFLVILPPYFSFYNGSKRLTAAERVTGSKEGLEAGLMLLLYILLSPVAIYLYQSSLNRVLEAQAAGAGAALEGAPEQPFAAPEAPVQAEGQPAVPGRPAPPPGESPAPERPVPPPQQPGD